MFGTEHADRLVILAQRDIEHRADVVGRQVGLEEFTGARVGPGVVSGDDAFALDWVEIGRYVEAT
jgi:hypothetical protein